MPAPEVRRLIILPDDTCCHRAALYFLKQHAGARVTLMTVGSFYEGREKIEEMKISSGSYLLIPDISEINGVITGAHGWDWDPRRSFPLPNPPLHFARATHSTVPRHKARCASIPALHPLLENDHNFDHNFDRPSRFRFHDVHTTQAAATAAAEGEAGFCITNEAGLRKHKTRLESVFQLKQMTVYWKLFHFNPS